MDGRLLPGFSPDDMLTELRQLIGDEAELEIARYSPGYAEANMGMFDTLRTILQEADPDLHSYSFSYASRDRWTLLRTTRHSNLWLHTPRPARRL